MSCFKINFLDVLNLTVSTIISDCHIPSYEVSNVWRYKIPKFSWCRQFTPSVLCALPPTQKAGLLLNKRTEVIACVLRSTETLVVILHGSDDICVISTERLVELQTTNH